jgi:S-adenosylmethionine synthetase
MVARPDRIEIGQRGMVARQQQVVAVVDRHADGEVVIGAAAPAGLAGRLINVDAYAALDQLHGSGKAGKPSADDMDRARHHTMA